MKISDRAVLAQLAQDHGIIFQHPVRDFSDLQMALDAQPTAITTANSGILNILASYVDPKTIDVLFAPKRATEIFSEEKIADWVTPVAYFPLVEKMGQTTSYDDYADNGSATANINWENRQQFYFMTMLELGEREIEMAGKGRFDIVSATQQAAVEAIDRFQNKSYFYGISGLKNYGILNDPDLYAAIAPNTVNSQTTWANKDSVAIINDVTKLISQLILQNNGLITIDSPFTLVMSPYIEGVMASAINQFGVNVLDELKKRYKNIKYIAAPEYATGSGQLVQAIADSIDGQQTGMCAFSEKLRSHPVDVRGTHYSQKKSAGTWGAIIKQPSAIAQMIGV